MSGCIPPLPSYDSLCERWHSCFLFVLFRKCVSVSRFCRHFQWRHGRGMITWEVSKYTNSYTEWRQQFLLEKMSARLNKSLTVWYCWNWYRLLQFETSFTQCLPTLRILRSFWNLSNDADLDCRIISTCRLYFYILVFFHTLFSLHNCVNITQDSSVMGRL